MLGHQHNSPSATDFKQSNFHAVLPAWVGYNVLFSIACAATILYLTTTYVQRRFAFVALSEACEYSAASRSVKPFLVCSAVVSSWTWSGTLIQSTVAAYLWGVAGAYIFSSILTVQIIAFGYFCIKVKQCSGAKATTVLQIIALRHGPAVHCLLILYGLATNFAVCIMSLEASSAILQKVTGANAFVANLVTMISVSLYTLVGGLRAIMLADYAHNLIFFGLILTFFCATYNTSDQLGSVSKMYHLLEQAARQTPVPGNDEGSYLTMRSKEAVLYTAMSSLSSMGMLFSGHGHWQRGIAARHRTVLRAFFFAGVSWLALPLCLGNTLGLAAIALRSNRSFPTYPNVMTYADLTNGLVTAGSAYVLMGKPGAVLLLVLVMTVITTSLSSELLAASSILTHDVYRTYYRPTADNFQLIRMSKICIFSFGCIVSIVNCFLDATKEISSYWHYVLMGVLVCPSIPVIVLTVTWKKQSRIAALVAPIGGTVIGLCIWLIMALRSYGNISLYSTGDVLVSFVGVTTSFSVSVVLSVVISLIRPAEFDFSATREIDPTRPDAASTTTTYAPEYIEEEDPFNLAASARKALVLTFGTGFFLLVCIPGPLWIFKYQFSEGFFRAWIVGTGLAVCVSILLVIIMPLVESRAALREIFAGVWRLIVGQSPFRFNTERSSVNSVATVRSGDRAAIELSKLPSSTITRVPREPSAARLSPLGIQTHISSTHISSPR